MKKAIYLLVFVFGITTNVYSKGYYILTCINHTTGDSLSQIGNSGSNSMSLTAQAGDSLTLFVYLNMIGSNYLQTTGQWYLNGDSIQQSLGVNPLNITAPASGIISESMFNVTMQFIFTSPTGIFDPGDSNSHLIIFPNATSSSLNIQINLVKPGDVSIDFYDLHGKLLKESSYKKVSGQFVTNENVEGLENGVYFIRVKSANELFSKRFIKL